MPHIFRFHKGRNNNIIDWKSSDRITAEDVKEVLDKSVTISSSAGTSIPTPLARMFLFKTAFDIVSAQVRDSKLNKDSIYAGLVSETLDLLELLYKSGSDNKKFKYKRWVFENNDVASSFFGAADGHRLLSKSFAQASEQAPFQKSIEITLIYYLENNKEVLMGGTSPFTFVFTTPNFKRKLKERGFNDIPGLKSLDYLFDTDYLQLHERDESFIKYIESLANTQRTGTFFKGFSDYVTATRAHFEPKFNGKATTLQDIRVGEISLIVSEIALKQVTSQSQQVTISHSSDFKIDLPAESPYLEATPGKKLIPLFLLDRMEHLGQYSSPSSFWSSQTRITEIIYPENRVDEVMQRELPGINIKYPFLSSFDIFEAFLVKLPGYQLNDERFVTIDGSHSYLFPIKPLFFHFFPIDQLDKYLRIETDNKQVTFTISIPIYGPTKHHRTIVCSTVYDLDAAIQYSGILGIFPFTKAEQPQLLHINDYTVASFEKTNAETAVTAIKFLKKNGTDTLLSNPTVRSNYTDVNTKTTYYQVKEAFDLIQLNFRKKNVTCGGIIIPKFRQVINGDAAYIYAIDFGTSNTHIEYGRVEDVGGRNRIAVAKPFEITEENMQMFLLNKPQQVSTKGGAEKYIDFELSMGSTIDSARQITIREFVPFQIGAQKSASVKFPFRTATCESNTFSTSSTRLFIDANIGFYIDEDVMSDHVRYKTDLKWLLQKASTDQLNINRVAIFAKELMLMIRTKVLLGEDHVVGNLNKLRLILSFPISMGETLKVALTKIFEEQRLEVFGSKSLPLAHPVTESIAPYYQLKSKYINIQNDNFCNIDIGGGTTDIVLTRTELTAGGNPNELQCYCSSFKFAGRQLWSSGGNEYQLDENGFVAHYKDFIRRTDPGISDKLVKILNNNTVKTEDVVGLLFSKPEYRFKDVFSDNHELKVIPLIHYASILFYVSRISAWKDIKLPRTVSFSGKGSEYLNLLFPLQNSTNDSDLKGFTQRLLGIFSKEQVRSDFQVKREHEPKVITAKGALHYAVEDIKDDNDEAWGNASTNSGNTSEKKLIKRNVVFMGFQDLDLEKGNYTYGDFISQPELYNDIMNSQLEFFNLLFDDLKFNAQINKKLELRDFGKYKQFFVPKDGDIFNQGPLRDSFKATIANYDPTEKVDDSPFFFPINYTLTELSKSIAASATNQR